VFLEQILLDFSRQIHRKLFFLLFQGAKVHFCVQHFKILLKD
jgi:hypothetical protein